MNRHTILILAALAVGCSSDREGWTPEPVPNFSAGQHLIRSLDHTADPVANLTKEVFINLADQTWRHAQLLYIDHAGLHCGQSQVIPGGAVILRETYGWDEVERWWWASEGERP